MDSPVEPVIPHKLHAKYDFWRIRENSKVLQFLCRLKLQVRALNYPSRQEGADANRTLRAICAESQAYLMKHLASWQAASLASWHAG